MYKLVKNLQPYKNCSFIHPLQQRNVAEMIQGLLSSKYADDICSIIIFGSSVTDRCHVGSDIDIFVVLSDNIKEPYPKLINKAYNFPYDLWTNKTIDERLLAEIQKTGVNVYDK